QQGHRLQGLRPVPHRADHLDLVADRQKRRQRLTEQGLVVDEEHPPRAVGAHPGTSTRTQTPAPGLDSIVSEPPKPSTRSRMPTRPNPLPGPRPRPSSTISRLTESSR